MAEGRTLQAQDTSERLRRLYELALTVAGDPVEVFDRIVKIIAELFDIKVAIVERLEGDRIITLSMYLDGRVLHEGVFDLAGTPCADVRRTHSFCHFNAAAEHFPKDQFLRDHGIESYIGLPVISASGEVIAIINAMNDRPIHLTNDDRLFLEAMASRVRLELEREKQASEAQFVRTLLNELAAANERLQEADRLNTAMIAELSTPIIPVWDRVLFAPMIGSFTAERAEAMTDALLEKTANGGADVVILDITGVRTVGSDAAQQLRNTVSAIHLLGARCIVTGIRASVAQTLVQLGIKLEGIITRRKLSDALQLALEIIAKK